LIYSRWRRSISSSFVRYFSSIYQRV
jgi:hypothetical protein